MSCVCMCMYMQRIGRAEDFSEHLLSYSIRKTALAENQKAQILVLAL